MRPGPRHGESEREKERQSDRNGYDKWNRYERSGQRKSRESHGQNRRLATICRNYHGRLPAFSTAPLVPTLPRFAEQIADRSESSHWLDGIYFDVNPLLTYPGGLCMSHLDQDTDPDSPDTLPMEIYFPWIRDGDICKLR